MKSYIGPWSLELSSKAKWTMSSSSPVHIKLSLQVVLWSCQSHFVPESLGRLKANWSQTWTLSTQGLTVSGANWPDHMTPLFLFPANNSLLLQGRFSALLQSFAQDISHFLLYNSSFHFTIWNISLYKCVSCYSLRQLNPKFAILGNLLFLMLSSPNSDSVVWNRFQSGFLLPSWTSGCLPFPGLLRVYF